MGTTTNGKRLTMDKEIPVPPASYPIIFANHGTRLRYCAIQIIPRMIRGFKITLNNNVVLFDK